MNTYIGIDLGTSAVKLLLVGADGTILNSVSVEYPICYPQSGWSEQNPEDWYGGVTEGIKRLLTGQDKRNVRGISFGGQMHGLVILDKADRVIRPAILWNDGRTQKQTDYLNNVIGKDKLSAYTANIAFAGFTAPKILWVKENEKENFAAIDKIMLPKDYIAYRLTGARSTDYSDASGMLLLDVEHRRWSKAMLSVCGVNEEQLPALYESFAPVGTLKKDVAAELGLSESVIVCAGAGDNAAAAVGTGTVSAGDCNISLGTSGTVFIVGDRFSVDKNNALHSFCHANGGYHLMGCLLSAASCNSWWSDRILKTNDYSSEQSGLEKFMGENDVYFLPYLMGERSPHNDVNARGAFIGMRPSTERGQMNLAVLEGVAYALKDCVNVAESGGITIKSTRICGGGARSALWRQIIADVLNIPVQTLCTEEGPSYGAAMLAMVGCGEYRSVEEVAHSLIKVKETILPRESVSEKYGRRYKVFKELYPALKGAFADFNK